jgi:4-amino-4-deoxy-L-arabinose transferase-like glycosyltransferase
MTVILLLAACLRLYGISNVSPPGLEHDEVAHWLINQDILAGNHGVYFTEAYGHEAGFHYLQTGFMVLLGDNALALRLPSALAGLLGVAITFALIRRLFGFQAALLAAGLLAVLFWPVFYSRLALRAIALPMLSGLTAYFWWQGWQSSPRTPSRSWPPFLLAGLFAGLSLHTYMAARSVPIFYGLFLLYLLLFHRSALGRRWREVLLFTASAAVAAGPLVLYLLANPGAEYRIGEVNAPLLALQSGNLRPVLENSLKIIGMFGWRGDPLWRQNIADLPVFDPITAIFFFVGIVISIYRWREIRNLFAILWLFTAAIPSIVTIDAPSSIRMINALPVLTLFPAIGWQVIHFSSRLSTVSTKLSTKTLFYVTWGLALILLVYNTGRTWHGLFSVWPASSEVQFVWQQAFTEAAGYLDRDPAAGPVAIGGWTPETMDAPTMALNLVRDDLSLRFFDPGRSLIVPNAASGQTTRIIRPAVLPLDPAMEGLLLAWGSWPQERGSFVLYHVPAQPAVAPQVAEQAAFDQQITLLGYDWLTPSELISYWRVEAPAGGPRRIYIHLVDESGQTVTQDDGLGAPAEFWQAGDLIVQRHSLALPAGADSLAWRLGIYDPQTGRRLLTPDGRDYVLLRPAAVE